MASYITFSCFPDYTCGIWHWQNIQTSPGLSLRTFTNKTFYTFNNCKQKYPLVEVIQGPLNNFSQRSRAFLKDHKHFKELSDFCFVSNKTLLVADKSDCIQIKWRRYEVYA